MSLQRKTAVEYLKNRLDEIRRERAAKEQK